MVRDWSDLGLGIAFTVLGCVLFVKRRTLATRSAVNNAKLRDTLKADPLPPKGAQLLAWLTTTPLRSWNQLRAAWVVVAAVLVLVGLALLMSGFSELPEDQP
jgi:hypothetical protein